MILIIAALGFVMLLLSGAGGVDPTLCSDCDTTHRNCTCYEE